MCKKTMAGKAITLKVQPSDLRISQPRSNQGAQPDHQVSMHSNGSQSVTSCSWAPLLETVQPAPTAALPWRHHPALPEAKLMRRPAPSATPTCLCAVATPSASNPKPGKAKGSCQAYTLGTLIMVRSPTYTGRSSKRNR